MLSDHIYDSCLACEVFSFCFFFLHVEYGTLLRVHAFSMVNPFLVELNITAAFAVLYICHEFVVLSGLSQLFFPWCINGLFKSLGTQPSVGVAHNDPSLVAYMSRSHPEIIIQPP